MLFFSDNMTIFFLGGGGGLIFLWVFIYLFVVVFFWGGGTSELDNFYGLFLQIKCFCICSVIKITLIHS